jgi:hypothetical protein
MIKALPKYLILICVVLLSGYGQLSAHQSRGALYSLKNLKGTEHTCPVITRDEDAFFFKSSFNTENQKYRLGVPFFENEEEEDDEPISLKKHFSNGNYLAFISFAQNSGQFTSSKRVLPFNGFFSNTSSSRYILFQVFRI